MPNVEDNDYIIDYVEIIHDLLKENSDLKEEISTLRYALGRFEADTQELRDKLANR
tara:strand:+ start:54 stop:221 length:168 start_codon:yes stop_codon:yes gene_type:complete